MRYLFALLLVCVQLSAQPELHICTVASKHTKGLKQLLKSCKRYSINIDVLGLDMPYPGNGQKLLYMQEYLKNLPDEDIVLFVDAYDVLFLANTEQILDKFYKFNAPFAIAVEINCYPFENLAEQYPLSPTPFRYLNSGTYIGYVGFIKNLLAEIEPIKPAESDQGQLALYFLQNPEAFALDYYCELFFPVWGVELKEIKIDPALGSITCLITGSTPCILHGQGPGKWIYQLVYNKLFRYKN